MKIFNLKYILLSYFVLNISQAFAFDPRLNYQEMSSDHFTVIYDAKSYEAAKVYLTEAETAYRSLTTVFSEAPAKTILVLDNSTDQANGMATAFPRPTIYAYINPPAPLSTIDEYSFWPRDLIMHEYTHILNMEPSHGVFKPLRTIFGSYMRPNMILPHWYLEGLAVEMESRFNENGRLKSTDYDGMMRAFFLDHKWNSPTENLSAIGELDTPSWPQGQRPYFLGALVVHELALKSKTKTQVYEDLNQRYSARVPFFITQPLLDQLGETYQAVLDDVYARYSQLLEKQIDIIRSHRLNTVIDTLHVDHEVNSRSAVVSPDGQKLAVISDLDSGKCQITIFKKDADGRFKHSGLINLQSADWQSLEYERGDIQRVSWFPDSKRIAFDAINTVYHYYRFYDLLVANIETGKSKELTRGFRAREPDVSPQGDKIVYVSTDVGETSLNIIDVNGKNSKRVYTPPKFLRVSSPSFISDTEIVFSQKDSHGDDQLQVLDLKKLAVVRSYHNLKNSRQPHLANKEIVFTSTQSGVENLYATSFDFKTTRALTNSLTRVQNGTIDPETKTVIYSEMTSGGPQMKIAKLESLGAPAKVEHPVANDFPKDHPADVSAVQAKPSNYHSLPYMFPLYWIPYVELAPDGLISSVTTSGQEPLGLQSYLLQGIYDSRPGKFGGVFAYKWDNTFGSTNFIASNLNTYYAGPKQSANNRDFEILHGIDIFPNSEKYVLVGGYFYREVNVLEFTTNSTNRSYYENGPKIEFDYLDMEQFLTDISPHGNAAEISYSSIANRTLDRRYGQFFVNLNHNHTKWLPAKNVLALNFKAARTPNTGNIYLGSTTSQAEFTVGPSQDGFVIRGYPDGEFIGFTMLAATAEYRFPISDIYRGPNDPGPYFVKRVSGDVFVDGVSLNGGFFDRDNVFRSTHTHSIYVSSGAELKFDANIAYNLPITFKFVGAYGFDKNAQGGGSFYTILSAPQLF